MVVAVAQVEGKCSAKDDNRRDQMDHVKGRPGEEPRVGANKFNAEAAQWIPDEIAEEEIAWAQLLLKAAREPEDQAEADKIPQRFIQKEGVKARAFGKTGKVMIGGNAMFRVNA